MKENKYNSSFENLYLIDLSGKIMWKKQVDERSRLTESFYNDYIYTVNRKSVHNKLLFNAFGKHESSWQMDLQTDARGGVFFEDGKIFVVARDGIYMYEYPDLE